MGWPVLVRRFATCERMLSSELPPGFPGLAFTKVNVDIGLNAENRLRAGSIRALMSGEMKWHARNPGDLMEDDTNGQLTRARH